MENKPIFLSLAYFTCHWLHVMERGSVFRSRAAILNPYSFHQVDREERPDIARMISRMSKPRERRLARFNCCSPPIANPFSAAPIPPDHKVALTEAADAWSNTRFIIRPLGAP